MNDSQRANLKKRVTISVAAEYENESVRGNCMASGNDVIDRQCEDEIIADYNSGNDWAWCMVHVRAEYDGFVGHAYLGACSYASCQDFKRGGYYEQMVEEALDDLAKTIERAAETIKTLD